MNGIQWRSWIAVEFWYIQSENGLPFGMLCVWHLSLAISCTLAMKMWIFQESDGLICWDQSMLEVKALGSWLYKVFDPERDCIACVLLALESMEDNTTNVIYV